MDYNTVKLPDYDYIEDYPVTVVFEVDESYIIEVKLVALAVGYGGTGPAFFAKLLDFYNIQYDEDDLYTKKRMEADKCIHLKYKIES